MKTTIDMAREAGNDDLFDALQIAFLERLVALVRADERNRTWTQEHWTEYERSIAAAEREACVEAINSHERQGAWVTREEAIEAIRARGQA
jgi:hypothetical protein